MLDLGVQSLVKYLLGGTVVAAAAYCIQHKPANMQEIGMIAVSAVVAFIVLDILADSFNEKDVPMVGGKYAPRKDGRCGPDFDRAICTAEFRCCSRYAHCGNTPEHCNKGWRWNNRYDYNKPKS